MTIVIIEILVLSGFTFSAASTCTTSSSSICAQDGSDSYLRASLSYNNETGIFTGTMTTNGCPSFPYSNYSSGTKGLYVSAGGTSPTCKTVTFPVVTATPSTSSLLGNVGYSITGTNIYGCMDNGFTAGQACSINAGTCDKGTDVGVCFAQMGLQCGSSLTTTMGLIQKQFP